MGIDENVADEDLSRSMDCGRMRDIMSLNDFVLRATFPRKKVGCHGGNNFCLRVLLLPISVNPPESYLFEVLYHLNPHSLYARNRNEL